ELERLSAEIDLDCRYLVGSPEDDGPIPLFCPEHEDTSRPNFLVYANGAWCFACGHYKSRQEFIAWVDASPEEIKKAAEHTANAASKSWAGRYRNSYIVAAAESY